MKKTSLRFVLIGFLLAGVLVGYRAIHSAIAFPLDPDGLAYPERGGVDQASSEKWRLWTEGAQLRGANIYQRRVYLDLDGEDFLGDGKIGPPYTQEDINRLAAMGANFVNISHPGLFTEEPPYALDPEVEANLDKLLAMVAEADMYAVITFRTGPGRSEFWAFVGEDTQSDPEAGWFPASYYNNRVWNDRDAQDAWAAMWRYAAEKYEDHPIVIGYDLMCEPNANEVGSFPDGPFLDIWDAEEFYARYGGTLYDWNQFYPRVVAAIREVDATTPILVGGMGYSAVDWLPYLQPISDPYIVYTVHQYAPMVYTHQEPPEFPITYPGFFDGDEDGEPEQVDRSWLESLLTTVEAFVEEHEAVVAVNEFGVMRWEPNAAQFLGDEMALFERLGLNSALWLWESSWAPYASEVDAFNFRHGPDPDQHQDVPTSALIQVIENYWSRNQVRPSTARSPTTYYVRIDGGSPQQCTGLVDAPYPGEGLHQPCAWDHPFRALPPDGPARLRGGDTLIIGPGSYRMGFGAPGAQVNGEQCAADYPWGCVMPPIPSGPDTSQPTRILGAGWDQGCTNPPELWGAERAAHILDLSNSRYIEIACLEITDHASCAEFHSGDFACERTQFPYGNWASTGIYAQDASNVLLQDINIHGLANAGIRAGRLRDWEVARVRLAGNGWVGWDGDILGEDANDGVMRFTHWTVAWNGCVETWPEETPTGCWAQSAGGYGDGVGVGATGGDWIIEDALFVHNTSDGLDLFYHTLGGKIVLRRVRSEGNAGNPVKVTGETRIENSVLIANCAFFDDQSFTYQVDSCRALGNALSLHFMGGESIQLVNNTLYGQGDGLVAAGPRTPEACNGQERLMGRNNLFLGDVDYFDPDDFTFLFYEEGCPNLNFDGDYNLFHRVKLSAYQPGPHDIAAAPKLTGPLSGMTWGMELTCASPAIDAGTAAMAPTTDFLGRPRDSQPDIGAYEWQQSPSGTATPVASPSPNSRLYLPWIR